MVIEFAALAFAALDSIREGVRFTQEKNGRQINLSLTIKRVEQGSDSVLAFGRVTNNADEPVTITEMRLILGNVRTERAPLVSLDSLDSKGEAGELIQVRSHTGSELYEGLKDLNDLRVLDSDLYLQPKESRTGWMFFPVPRKQVDDLDEAIMEFCIGDDLRVQERLSHFRGS